MVDRVGAQLSDLESLAGQFSTQSKQVESLISAIESSVSSAHWEGGRANDFRSKWETFKASLTELAGNLEENATAIRAEAQAYDQVLNQTGG